MDDGRVVLVHDWLTGMRGGEKVLDAFAELFPRSPLCTLIHQPGTVSPRIEDRRIVQSVLASLPLARRAYRHYLPLLPYCIERLTLPEADLVLSSSSCVAKGVRPPLGALHASYIHSPMRYLYDRYADYFAPGRAGWMTRLAMSGVRKKLQKWDRQSTSRVHALACNSRFVANRIARHYGRRSTVIPPPVEVDRFAQASGPSEDYFLMVTALVPYKNVDIAIEAFRGLPHRLWIAGSGPMEGRLRQDLPANVTLLGWVPDSDLPTLVGRARAFLAPQVEDFGIAMVEAMAAGRPVLALGEGGARDSIADLDRFANLDRLEPDDPVREAMGPTGLFFHEATPDGIRRAVARFVEEESAFDPDVSFAWARQFDRSVFLHRIRAWLESLVAGTEGDPAYDRQGICHTYGTPSSG